jgi:hypothetical protein
MEQRAGGDALSGRDPRTYLCRGGCRPHRRSRRRPGAPLPWSRRVSEEQQACHGVDGRDGEEGARRRVGFKGEREERGLPLAAEANGIGHGGHLPRRMRWLVCGLRCGSSRIRRFSVRRRRLASTRPRPEPRGVRARLRSPRPYQACG